MVIRRIVGLCLTALWSMLAGCTYVSIQSNMNSASLPRFTNILVVVKTDYDATSYLTRFERAFPRRYEVCSLAVGKLSFGDPDSLIRDAAQRHRSEVVLTIVPFRTSISGSGKNINTNEEVFMEMQTLPDQKSFWKGMAYTDGSSYINPKRIVEKLAEDRLIIGIIP